MSRSHSVYEVEGESFTVYKASEGVKASAATKIVWNGRSVSYLNTKGEMYSSRISDGSWYVGQRWGLKDIGLIEDAVALGVLSGKINVARLRKLKEEAARIRSAGWDADSFVSAAKKLGIKLSTAQKRVADRIAERAQQAAKGL